MTHPNGTFILLQNGVAKCYSSDLHDHIVPRVEQLYKAEPGAEYLIVQVVGTVEKPTKPVINSVYLENT